MPTKPKAPAKKAAPKKAAAVSLCRPSAISREAGHDLRVFGDKDVGKYLATVSKKQKTACKKSHGLAGVPKKPLSAGQKANTARVRKIAARAKTIYYADSYSGEWTDATKKASRELTREGKI